MPRASTTMALAALAFATCWRHAASAGADPCAALAGYYTGENVDRKMTSYYAPLSVARACINSVPLQTAAANQTIKTLKAHLSMYSYGDLVRNYTLEPRFAIAVDINAALDAVPTSGTSEYAFHRAVSDVIDSLHDPHTQYTAPNCWQSTSLNFFLPFAFSMSFNASGLAQAHMVTDVHTATSQVDQYWATLETTKQNASMALFKKFVKVGPNSTVQFYFPNTTISTINGQPWLDYAQKFKNNPAGSFSSREPNTRLNEAFTTTFSDSLNFRLGTGMPDEDNITVGFNDGSSYTFPWVVVQTSHWGANGLPTRYTKLTNVTYSAWCTTNRSSASGRRTGSSTLRHESPRPMPRTVGLHEFGPKELRKLLHSRRSLVPEGYAICGGGKIDPPCAVNPLTKLGLSVTGDSVILRIASFNPTKAPLEFVHEFSAYAEFAYAGIKAGKYKRLIMDVRGNGGGMLVLGYFGVSCLTKHEATSASPLMNPSFMRHNPGFNALVKACSGDRSAVCKTLPRAANFAEFNSKTWSTRYGLNPLDPADQKYFAQQPDQFWCPAGGSVQGNCTGHCYIRGGGCSPFSNALYYPDAGEVAAVKGKIVWGDGQELCKDVKFTDKRKLVVLSNGACGSTCSVFTRTLQNFNASTSVAMGGAVNTPMNVASFGGGEVWDWDVVQHLPTVYKVATPNTFPPEWPYRFPMAHQTLSFVPREIHNPAFAFTNSSPRSVEFIHKGVPQEFVFTPADVRLYPSSKAALAELNIPGADQFLYNETAARVEACSGRDCRDCRVNQPSSVNGCGAFMGSSVEPSTPCCQAPAENLGAGLSAAYNPYGSVCMPVYGTYSSIKQTVTMSGSVQSYVGNLKAMIEQGYGKAIGIFNATASPPAYKTGCSVTSTAAAARRSNIKVSFVATTSAATSSAASTAANALASNDTALLTSAINAVKAVNTTYNSTAVPSVSAIMQASVTTISAATGSVEATCPAYLTPNYLKMFKSQTSSDGGDDSNTTKIIIIVVVCVVALIVVGVVAYITMAPTARPGTSGTVTIHKEKLPDASGMAAEDEVVADKTIQI